MAIPDLFPDESKETSMAQFNEISLNETFKSDLEFLHKNGEKRWVNLEAVKLSQNRILGFFNDITQKKHAEQALYASEANLAKAQSIAHIGSWEWNLITNTVSL